ncbi:recombinase family protein [Verrucomicrobiales bacterium]|nr:recombinase family protein [Verrucomicrobiales bacterium]
MKYVIYKRVSTARQGLSRLGLEGQEKTVRDYLADKEHEIVGILEEIESGRKKTRPELAKALKLAKKHKATLLVANASRLARNVHFLTGILESGVEIVFLDMPHANRFTIQIMACVAEEESRQISLRVKKALAARAARGLKNGVTGKDRAKQNKKRADEFAESMRPHLDRIGERIRSRKEGKVTIKKLTETLNSEDVKPFKSKKWHNTTVSRLCKRLNYSYS